MSGESLAFFELLRSNPDYADAVQFAGVHFPSINKNDYLALHPRARQRAYFMSPSLRSHLASGRANLVPLDYPGIVRDLTENIKCDVAIAQVTPPGKDGRCSLGPCADFLPAIWNGVRTRIAHINPSLPRTRGTFSISLDDCVAAFESDSPIPSLDDETSNRTSERHGQLVATLIPDGATLQVGVGRLQAAVFSALKCHRGLGIHSGMISRSTLGLLESGAVAGDRPVECGVALGDAAFYREIDDDERFLFRPVTETHDVRRIASIKRFFAINAAVEVDLFGQVNVDSLQGRFLAGVGGLPAFVTAARLSSGGRSIVVLPATATGGKSSRIVPALSNPAHIALARHDADYVVTEFGVADLRNCGIQSRAEALIGIAAPEFRDSLDAAWDNMCKRF
jgi:acyl-CoA hydrolase